MKKTTRKKLDKKRGPEILKDKEFLVIAKDTIKNKQVATKKKSVTTKATKKKSVITKTPRKKPVKLRASQVGTWAKCKGWIKLEKNQNPLADKSAADFGTLCHKLAENLLRGQTGKWLEYDYASIRAFVAVQSLDFGMVEKVLLQEKFDEAVEYLEFYYNAVREDVLYYIDSGYKIDVYIEQGLEYKGKDFIITGTADLVLVLGRDTAPTKFMIYDVKFGRTEIEATGNLQLWAYAHLFANSFADSFDFSITAVIIQPPLKSKKLTYINYDHSFLSSAYKPPADGRRLLFKTGKQCIYCDYNDVCPILKQSVKRYMNPKFLDVSIDRASTWGRLLDIAKPIVKMFEQVSKNAKNYAMQGVNIAGYELATKGGQRAWIQEANVGKIQKSLGLNKSDVETIKTTSPAQIEKFLKVKFNGAKREKKLECLRDLVYSPIISYLKKKI